MEFDEIFPYIGDIGLYQILLYFLVNICSFCNGMMNVGINLFAAEQDHWCRVPGLDNFPHEVQKYVSVPYSEDDPTQYDRCSVYDLDYDQLDYSDIVNWNRSTLANVTTRGCDDGWVYDQGQFVSTINSQYDLVCGRSWMSQFVSTAYMAGMFVGSALSGVISDRFGRHKPLLIGCLGHMCFAFGQAFAPNYPVYVAMRFLTSMSNFTAYLSSFIIVMEFIGPKYRTLLGVMFQSFSAFGIVIISGVGYAIRDQRHSLVVIGCAVAVTFPFIWIVPESPRWLISQGRHEEAERILRKVAKINERNFPDKIDWDNKQQTKDSSEAAQPVTMKQVCQSSILCRELALIYLNWFTTSLVYYGITYNAGSYGGLFLNTFLSGLIEIPAHVLCWLAMDKGNKRFANAACVLVAGVFCFACVPIIVYRPDLTSALTALSTIGKGAITFSFASIYLVSAEMFPTRVRHVALGTSSMFARIGSGASPYMGPPMEAIWAPLPVMIFGCLAIFTGSLLFLLPDTRGHKLPDTIEEAEYIGRFQKTKSTLKPKLFDDPDITVDGHAKEKNTFTNTAFVSDPDTVYSSRL